jgi:hypothetical protein
MTAVSLLLATVRSKTVSTDSGLRDRSGDAADPEPGIGIDDDTPLGDTSEHSDAIDDPESAEGRSISAERIAPGRRSARTRA